VLFGGSNLPWVLKVTLAHIKFWNTDGRHGEYLALGFGGFGPIPTTLQNPDGLPRYNPLLRTRADYLEIVGQNALLAINEHLLLRRIDDQLKTDCVASLAESAHCYCDEAEAHLEAQERGALRAYFAKSFSCSQQFLPTFFR
jgi:hypothetical protein